MKQIFIPICAAAFFAAGCRVVEVENRGEEIARDADGKPILCPDGTAQTIKKGWNVYHNQHWMWTRADTITAAVRPAEIDFAMNGLQTEPSDKLGEVIEKSLSGIATLTEKVGAAIATSGASVAGDAARAAITKAIGNFVNKGGDPAKATATCANGNCTITDGTITETCVNCFDK